MVDSKNLCQLCLENELPFKAKRDYWREAYVIVEGYSDETIRAGNNTYFKVYGKVVSNRRLYRQENNKNDNVIRNSGVYGWEVL